MNCIPGPDTTPAVRCPAETRPRPPWCGVGVHLLRQHTQRAEMFLTHPADPHLSEVFQIKTKTASFHALHIANLSFITLLPVFTRAPLTHIQ